MTIGAGEAGARLIQGVLVGSQNVHRHAAQGWIGLQGGAQVVAAAVPQRCVRDDQVRPCPFGSSQRLIHRSSGQESVVLAAQDHSEGLLDRQAVVGDQYALAHRVPKQSSFDNTGTRGGQLRDWNSEQGAESGTETVMGSCRGAQKSGRKGALRSADSYDGMERTNLYVLIPDGPSFRASVALRFPHRLRDVSRFPSRCARAGDLARGSPGRSGGRA